MKKFILMAAVAMMTTTSANAQYYDTKNELTVSIGAGANSEIIGGMKNFVELAVGSIITSTLTMGQYVGYTTYDNFKWMPPVTVGYYRHVSKLVAVGGYVGYNNCSEDVFANWTATGDGTTSKQKVGKAKHNNFSLMPSVKFHWVRTKGFGFYSRLGVGATLSLEKQEGDSDKGGKEVTDNSVYFNFDATPFGIDFGSQTIRGFLEFGMGEQGLLSAGLHYKF